VYIHVLDVFAGEFLDEGGNVLDGLLGDRFLVLQPRFLPSSGDTGGDDLDRKSVV
jgi:hypothetical protein